MKTVLETERLRLRYFTLDDTEFIIRLLNSPGWLQYIGDRNVRDKEQAENYLRNGAFKSYEVNGFGLSMVEIKDGNIPKALSDQSQLLPNNIKTVLIYNHYLMEHHSLFLVTAC